MGQGEQERLWRWETAGPYLCGPRHGCLPRRPSGDGAQFGGDFILDREGWVVVADRGIAPSHKPVVQPAVVLFRCAEGTLVEAWEGERSWMIALPEAAQA